jgi:hypothetical protein
MKVPPSPDDLAHVLWLGGSACVGKSAAARALAAAHGLTLYSCDERFEEHRQRASPARHPDFCRLMDLPAEALWTPPVAAQVRDLLRFYEDEFTMVVEDLREIPGRVIAEGVGLLPARVAAVLSEPHRACWLIATADFRRRHYPRRGVAELLGRCSDPQLAYAHWMARDDEIALYLEAQAAALALPCRGVDGTSTEAETLSELARQFRLRP